MSLDDYFLRIAEALAEGSSCVRDKNGAVVVKGDLIVGHGYNRIPPIVGLSCKIGDCPRASSGVKPGSNYDEGPGKCFAVHAEAAALLSAGRQANGAIIYCTRKPCFGCSKLIDAAGIARVAYSRESSNV